MKVLRLILALILLSTLSIAQEVEESKSERTKLQGKGLFIGVDFEKVKADTRYSSASQLAIRSFPNGEGTYTEPAFKIGYQYYFTRIYFKYSQVDEKTDDYTVESTSYELNTEYMPILYRGDSFAIRFITGLAIGFTENDLVDISSTFQTQLDETDVTDLSDTHAIYGIQIGLMLELSMGLSAEVGYRYRRGNLLETEADSGNTSFETKRRQFYGGLNYLF